MSVQGAKQLYFSYDRLYEKINFTPEDLRLFQTKELARLREVYLSAVPPWTIPAGTCASRFEHSVGVAYLARTVARKKEFKDLAHDLYLASLAHDLASPPFSHVGEPLQEKVLGKNHEEALDEILEVSQFGKEAKRQGGSLGQILKLVRGKLPPYSDILNGSIDIDNLDNSLRFCVSMGILKKPGYSPFKIAQRYAIQDGKLVFQKGLIRELEAWEKTRQVAYGFVYGPANLPPGTMLQRALDLAYKEGEIGRDFFFLTDSEAFRYLEEKCNPRTRTLARACRLWQFYSRVFKAVSFQLKRGKSALYEDFEPRFRLTNDLAKSLGAEPEEVAVFLGHDKGFKRIHIPILGQGGQTYHAPKTRPSFLAQVFVHPKHAAKQELIREFMKDKLSL